MEYYFFVIIVIIILKILFWTFYFYVRAQRMRQARTTQRFIIVGTQHPGSGRLRGYNDRSAIINHAEPVSEQAVSPPPYSEVVKDGNPLPPPYEHVVMGMDHHAAAGAGGVSTSQSYPYSSYAQNQSRYPGYPQAPLAGMPSSVVGQSQPSMHPPAGQ